MLIDEIKNKKIAIFGVGVNFHKRKTFILENLRPTICVDNNEKLWGKEICPDLIVKAPTELRQNEIDVVIITPENGYVSHSISCQLNGQYTVYTLNQIWDEFEVEHQSSIDFGMEDKRIKHFSCDVGSCVCNLNCSYCYVDFLDSSVKYNAKFPHSVDFMLRALSKQRLGGKALFNIVGQGETLLKPDFISLVFGLLAEGHFVQIVTNGVVTSKIKELLSFPAELTQRLLLAFSLHYIELKRNKLLDTFFDNFDLIRKAGISTYITFPAGDDYLPYLNEIRELCVEKTGILPVVSVIRKGYENGKGFPLGSSMDKEQYFKTWSSYQSKSHEMRQKTYGHICEKCYAGLNSGWINLATGELKTCSPGEFIDNIYDDIKQKIKFCTESHDCKWEYCGLNNLFLSGRVIADTKLPTFYDIYNRIDSAGQPTIGEEMKEAMDFCCDY